MPAGAGNTETLFLHVTLSLYIREVLCYFFPSVGSGPPFHWGVACYAISVHSLSNGINMHVACCRGTQTALRRLHSSLVFDF